MPKLRGVCCIANITFGYGFYTFSYIIIYLIILVTFLKESLHIWRHDSSSRVLWHDLWTKEVYRRMTFMKWWHMKYNINCTRCCKGNIVSYSIWRSKCSSNWVKEKILFYCFFVVCIPLIVGNHEYTGDGDFKELF